MNNAETRNSYLPKIFGIENFSLRPELLSSRQKLTLWLLIVITVIAKVFIIPYNMMDMGDSATRVWNALMWAQHPFFVLPESGHPLWFYMMGPMILVSKEIFYTPIITMILLMTLAGYYIFKTTLVLSDFRTALIAFAIFILNPVIFRLNFEPYSQQPYLAAACIMIFYFIKALGSENSGFIRLPSLFWFFHSDTALLTVAWTGFILALIVTAGFANAPILTVLWLLDMSIVHAGQEWYGYG